MKISTQLSVSSVILAAVISSGCSQQQVVGGSQVSGSSQTAGGSQVAGGQMTSQSQIEGGSQQQVEAPVVTKPVYVPAPVYTARPAPTVKRSTRSSGIGLPPAKPGQCYAKVKTPAKYITKSRQILVKKATSKRVLVRGPQYGVTTKRVLVRKAAYKTRSIPAQYKHVTQRVLVKPAYYKWSKKAQSKVVRIDHMTGEILCRVKVPAAYKNVTKKVLVRPARTHRTLVPAVYKHVKSKKLVAPAKYKMVTSPARYQTQNYRVKVGNARIVWRQVVCKAHAKPHKAYTKKVTYRKPVKQYRKATPRPTKRYTKPAISLHDYYAIMNAGKKAAPKKVKKTAKRKTSKSSGISLKDYHAIMNAGKKSSAKKAPTKSKKAKASKKSVKKVMKAKTTEKPATSAKKDATKDATATKQMSKENVIRSIQKALKAKGFDPGANDGKMGPGTAAALKAFQSSRGLPVGRLTKDTFRALGLIR